MATIVTRDIQAEALSGRADRLIQTVTLREGVVDVDGDSFLVSEDTGSNMQVTVGSGSAFDRCVIEGDVAGQGTYILEHQDPSVALAVAASDPADDRIDLVIARIYDDDSDSSGMSLGEIELIEGTPAANPDPPSLPDGAIALAEVLVEASTTEITNGDITDRRVEATLRDALGHGFHTYTPDLKASTTNPTRDDEGDQTGLYVVQGGLCTVWVRFAAGSGGTQGEGALFCDLPVPADTSFAAVTASTSAGNSTTIGSGHTRDASAPSNNITFSVGLRDTDNVWFFLPDGGALTNPGGALADENDVLTFTCQYPVAPAEQT